MSLGLAWLCAVGSVLACTFAAGCGSNPNSSIVVTLSPSSAQIDQGGTVNVSATVTSTGTVMDQNVTWSLSGAGCSGTSCGSLTNQTGLSVTYNAPASPPSSFAVSIMATSVANPSKFATTTVNVQAVTVSIQNAVTELAAGSGRYYFTNFSASVQNDPANGGVTWALTANGKACSPACGTISAPTIYYVQYAPPATVPAAPANTPTLTATSISDPSKSDNDTFTIFDGTAACGTGGNESLLNGQYAVVLQGWTGSAPNSTPLLFGATFKADGTGKITGGVDQFNPFVKESYTNASIQPSGSSYSVGPDNRGCLTLTDVTLSTYTLHFSLGGISSGVASKGDIIYFNQQSAIPSRASGILRKQDPSAFSLSALATNYALALDGWETSNGSLKHYALAGAFALNAGNISNGFCDANEGGHVLNSGGFWGTIPSIATADGTADATLQLPGANPGMSRLTAYIINSSELFFISFDLGDGTGGPVVAGRAIATSASFTSSSLSPNYIFRFTGNSSGATAALGVASFSGGLAGTLSGTMDQYAAGAASNQSLNGSYNLDSSTGRLSMSGAGNSTLPVCYMATPADGVSAFCVSTDANASTGVFDTQPVATYGVNSLSGNFIFGTNAMNATVASGLSGVATISSGSLQGTRDASTPTGFTLDSAISAALSIHTDGTGNGGPNTVAVTNGTVLYVIDESSGAPAEVQVFEQ